MSNKEAGLMKKTKKELVEIILRKDDVEAKLKEELEVCESLNAEINRNVEVLKEQKQKLTKDLEIANRNVQNQHAGMDNYASEVAELKEQLQNSKESNKGSIITNWVLSVALIVVIALWIIF